MANKIIIITAPSGAGKTSIVKQMLKDMPQLEFSISATTREARENEVDGKDYYFLTKEDFHEKIEAQAFAEVEMVYAGKYYGTLKSELERIWANERVPMVDIDVKGALSIKEHYGDGALTIFIQPPSMEALRKRLSERGTETQASLDERLGKAKYELSFSKQFDEIVINDTLEIAQAEVKALIDTFLK
ncbi:guanylate kinase [Chitinophaga sancti]|uniref:Guanylate kinase n=1 Tax=Chitinophaga sancti TaxID=1004 RepID=A0A1K1RJJ9_9BACT|nr:guanylate kinase [Chitinophaga sancti]WQD60691.1 guanylate kinase [Chitinophaga sancti]WQG87181.1 guanylate kinase [Chitinophaga sancti]SFW71979.1 guanylate kinase [Chitinophaga sancti]